MTASCLPGDTWTETLAYVMFWGAASAITATIILFNGQDFVDAPKLVHKEKMDWVCVPVSVCVYVRSCWTQQAHIPRHLHYLLPQVWTLYWSAASVLASGLYHPKPFFCHLSTTYFTFFSCTAHTPSHGLHLISYIPNTVSLGRFCWFVGFVGVMLSVILRVCDFYTIELLLIFLLVYHS